VQPDGKKRYGPKPPKKGTSALKAKGEDARARLAAIFVVVSLTVFYGVFAAFQALAEKKPVASFENSNRLARCFVELISLCKGYSG
jgi:hypothetical protein